MAADPNEIGAFIKNCHNKLYLMSLRNIIDERLQALGVPAGIVVSASFDSRSLAEAIGLNLKKAQESLQDSAGRGNV